MIRTKKQRKRTNQRRKSFMLSASRSDAQYAKRRKRKKLLGFFGKLKKNLQKIKQFRLIYVWYIIFGAMACFVLFALASPYFNLEKINITGDTYAVTPTEIEASLKELYGKNMLFIFDTDLKAMLEQEFPEFKSVEVTEQWPNTLELNITISPEFMTLINDENASIAAITEEGIVLPIPPSDELPIITVKQYPQRFQTRSKVISQDVLKKIERAQLFFQETISFEIKEIIYLWAAQELHIITNADTAIWIDLQEPIEEQIIKLKYGQDEIKLYENNFEHIDLRIPKQLIWKEIQ